MDRFPESLSFDDFLGLGARDFSRHRLVVFVGRSGSGKSTAIRFLLGRLPGSRVIDEIAHAGDLVGLWAPLAAGERLLVASHLSAACFLALRPFIKVAVFRTDRSADKIARYLERRGIGASARALRAFVRRYGATYTDAELIMERFPGASFDASLARFERFCSLHASRN
jgi:energy-coupling factor transporter ATP-binding protein EcfA2